VAKVTTVRVSTFPSTDVAFEVHVSRAQELIGGEWDRDRVLEQVRQAYPEATASRASDVAVLEFEAERWYIYRDGSARGATKDDWADDASLPCAIVGPDGRYIQANEAAAELFGVRRDEIPGRPVGSFTAHESDDEIGRRLMGLADGEGRLASTAIVKRPDGADLRIEFVVRSTGSEGHIVTMRRSPLPLSVGR
jgi:PAS domain S-box-containing protein